MNGKNLTLVMAFPHTHLAGTSVKTSIVRNGVDIGYAFYNKYYNFDFQQVYSIDPPVTLTPV